MSIPASVENENCASPRKRRIQVVDLRSPRSVPVTSIFSPKLGGILRCLRVACLLSPRPEHPFYEFVLIGGPK